METLPSSVSTLKLPPSNLPSTSREFFHFKNSPHLPHHHPLSTTSKVNSFSRKPNFLPHRSLNSNFLPSSLHLNHPPSPPLYSKSSSGYAAALIDIAQSHNSLHSVDKDVRRFSKILKNWQIQEVLNDGFLGERERGDVVREIAEKGRFQRDLVTLVKVLVGKNKVDILGDVLDEFGRIYDEMCGTQVVLVSSDVKVGKDEIFGIATRVMNLSGAVKVKVRNLVGGHESLASFAVQM